MTYSCSDFTDDILNALGVNVPDEWADEPGEQANLALGEIERLRTLANQGTKDESKEHKATRALIHLKAALALLDAAGSTRTAERVRAAISSAKGAVRAAGYRDRRDVYGFGE